MDNTKTLNKEQLSAIHHDKGPLLIIAGAGTGKTTVITERVRHLITKKGVKPEEILALTFTEKAAFEMEDRIDKIMPYGYSELWISTFHSFCDRVLRNDAIHFGLNPNYKLMSEADSVLFLKKNIFKLHLEYFRPLGNPNKFLEALLVHFARLSDEDITPDEYVKFAKSQQEELKLGKQNDDKIDEIKKTFELANAYKTYEQLKIKEGVMDFSNLISQTLALLRERRTILKHYQEQFKYILVDEFQDTNYAQNELAILLAGSLKNITVVADDDQAIYRWRGAALSNVIQFKNNFEDAKIITLSKNYRSTQEILDRSYHLIQNNNPNRLEAIENINKKLTSERKIKGQEVQFVLSNRVDEEAKNLANEIIELVSKKGKYQYKDIAILVRANNHSQPFTQTLSRLRIPYQFLGPGQLFLQEEIKDIICYLKVLCNLEDTVSLFRVLAMDVFNIQARDINYMLNGAKKRNISLFELLERIDEITISDDTKQKINTFVAMILRHLELTKKDSAGQILYYFLLDTGLFKTYLSYKTEKEEQKALNVAKFFDKIKSYETTNPDSNIYSVVDWIDLMMEMRENPTSSEIDLRNADAVTILTIHSSKGLEFPVVFMVNLVTDRFPTRERKEKIPLPQNLIKEILPEGDYHLQEERRLFYVGMTRARDLLYFTAAKFYAEGKREKKVSPFVFEALPQELKKEEKKLKEPTQLTLIDVTKDYEEQKDKYVEERSEVHPYKITWISYSQLQTFDMCPLHFNARYILNIPTSSTAPLSFGISIHNTFKDFYLMLKNGSIPTIEDFKTLLMKNWISEGYQEKSHEKYSIEKAENIIRNYYQKNFDPKQIPIAIELPFSFFLETGLKVTGKIDRIDALSDNKIEIIDYKTGSAEMAYKSSYKFQLGLYALAATKVKNDFLRKKPEDITVSLFYVETNEKITEKVSPEELIKVEQTILEKVKAIEASDFKCNKSPFCTNCEYKMLCSVT